MESIALFVTHIINTGLHNYASLSINIKSNATHDDCEF